MPRVRGDYTLTEYLESPDYSDRTNRSGYVVTGGHPANAEWGGAPEVEPVTELWTYYDHYREDDWDTVPERYRQEELVSDPTKFPNSNYWKPVAPDPKWTPPPEHEGVSTPSTYRFFRPFAQDTTHRFNGEHFSMASHSRNYPVYGMQPWEERRNTYRTEPPPRDIQIQDRPMDVEPDTPQATYMVAPDPSFTMFGPPQSWRL